MAPPFKYKPASDDIRVVVGLDFGTTFSGFSYAYIRENAEITVNDNWPGVKGLLKTNTVLQYDEGYKEVISWGAKALPLELIRKARNNNKLVELFKLHLEDVPEREKPELPDEVTPERAITDYLREMGKVIKEEINRCWCDINFYTQVRLIVTVPAGYTKKTKTIMRKCLFDAGLIKRVGTLSLQFITEPKAAAIHCMSTLKEHGLTVGEKYLVVDCGKGTVDLIVWKLSKEIQLREIAISTCEDCGGSYVDKKFLEFVESKVGESAMEKLKKNNYNQVNCLVQYFWHEAKIPFTGDESDYVDTFEVDIDRRCPALKKYVTGSQRDQLEEDDWVIELDFETVKGFFDEVIKKILSAIKSQLDRRPSCSVLFLVGEFSESKYLQSRVKRKFAERIKIAVPPRPVIAVVSGACQYGLDMKTVDTRVLRWTYGVEIAPKWQMDDPPDRKTPDGRIQKFSLLVRKGTRIDVTKEYSQSFIPPQPDSDKLTFNIYYTSKDDATYLDEPEMNLLGSFNIDMPDTHLGINRPVLVTLCFGSMEITVTAKNQKTGYIYNTKKFSSTERY